MKGDQRNIKGDSSLMKEYFKSIDDKLMNNRINPSNFSTSDVILRVLLPESIYKCWWSINPDSE